MPELTLYYRPLCGYCARVLRYMQDNQISIPTKNVSASAENRQELIGLSGGTQVPCLMIDGKPMFESKDIIDWLGENRETL